MEDEGAEEAILAEKPRVSCDIPQRGGQQGICWKEEKAVLAVWSPGEPPRTPVRTPAGGSPQPGGSRAGPGSAAGRAGAGRAGAGRGGAAGPGASGAPGKCLDRLKSETVPSPGAEALPPAPE